MQTYWVDTGHTGTVSTTGLSTFHESCTATGLVMEDHDVVVEPANDISRLANNTVAVEDGSESEDDSGLRTRLQERLSL